MELWFLFHTKPCETGVCFSYHGFRIEVSIPGNLTALGQSTSLHEGTGKGRKGIFHGIWSRPSWGVLITLESRPVHHQHRTKPGGNIPESCPHPQLSVAVTMPGDQESLTPCAPMPGYVWYDISSQLDPAITVESTAQSCSLHQWWDQ